MKKARLLAVLLTSGLALAVGCGDSSEDGDGSGTGPGTVAGAGGAAGSEDGGGGSSASGGAAASGGSGGGAASAGTGGTAASGGTAGAAASGGTGGTAASGGTAGAAASGGTGGCTPIPCQGKVYACGDCVDNDNDGKMDMADPDCLGPCHNSEEKYTGCIAGQNQSPCKADCYFDDDSGSGNDDCYWNWSCDDVGDPKGSTCPDNRNVSLSGTTMTCAEAEVSQSNTCEQICGPLVPNGCDCFGCCELPAGSGVYVYVGSTSDDSGKCEVGTCTLDAANSGDHDACKICKPVQACLNTCEHCELCLGKTELPADCFPPPPDGGAGTGGTGGQGGSAGNGGSGGSQCGGQICPPGSQACGLDCQPPCPSGQFCLTGCCQDIPG